MCKEVDDANGSNDELPKMKTELPEPYDPSNKPDENDTLRTPAHSTNLAEKSTTVAQSKGNPIEDLSVSS